MEDLQQKIGEILSDPSSMEQIKALSGMLGMNIPVPQSESPPEKPKEQSGGLMSSGGINGIPNMSMPSPEMLNMMMKLAPLLGTMNQENESTRLLQALKPFMSSQRSKKIDEAVRLMGLMRMLPILKNMGIELF